MKKDVDSSSFRSTPIQIWCFVSFESRFRCYSSDWSMSFVNENRFSILRGREVDSDWSELLNQCWACQMFSLSVCIFLIMPVDHWNISKSKIKCRGRLRQLFLSFSFLVALPVMLFSELDWIELLLLHPGPSFLLSLSIRWRNDHFHDDEAGHRRRTLFISWQWRKTQYLVSSMFIALSSNVSWIFSGHRSYAMSSLPRRKHRRRNLCSFSVIMKVDGQPSSANCKVKTIRNAERVWNIITSTWKMTIAMVRRCSSWKRMTSVSFLLDLDTPKLGVWILDGDVACSAPLLKFALKTESVERLVLILVASMTHPWALLSTLRKWANLIEEHLDRLKLDPTRLQEMRDRLQSDFQHYTEPTDASATVKSAARVPNSTSTISLNTTSSSTADEQIVLPLPEGVLSKSLGIPVMVVITKVNAHHASTPVMLLLFSVTPCRPWRRTMITKTNSSTSCNIIWESSA